MTPLSSACPTARNTSRSSSPKTTASRKASSRWSPSCSSIIHELRILPPTSSSPTAASGPASAGPWAEAVAIRGERIIAVGSRADIAKLASRYPHGRSRRQTRAPWLHRQPHPFHRRRLPTSFGRSARRQNTGRIQPPHRRTRQKVGPGRWIQGGDMGSRKLARRAPSHQGTDRRRNTRQSRRGGASRRAHDPGQQPGAAQSRHHQGHA